MHLSSSHLANTQLAEKTSNYLKLFHYQKNSYLSPKTSFPEYGDGTQKITNNSKNSGYKNPQLFETTWICHMHTLAQFKL